MVVEQKARQVRTESKRRSQEEFVGGSIEDTANGKQCSPDKTLRRQRLEAVCTKETYKEISDEGQTDKGSDHERSKPVVHSEPAYGDSAHG